MEQFSQYGHTIASLGVWALLNIILGMYSLKGRTPEGRCDCGKPKRNYGDPVYRADRAHMNALENSGPFIAATVAAMMAGAAPLVVNILASVFVVSRIAMAVVHIRSENEGLRSMTFLPGWVCMIGLAVMAIIAAF